MEYWYLGIADDWKLYIFKFYIIICFVIFLVLYLQKNILIWLKIILMKLLISTGF